MADHVQHSSHTSHQVEWDIPSFYHKSWNIVKMQPTLWLFGLAVVVLYGSSFRFNGGGGGSSSDRSDDQKESFIQKTTSLAKAQAELVSYATNSQQSVVLGVNDSLEPLPTADVAQPVPEEKDEFSDTLLKQFSQVPAYVYMLLFIEMLVVILFSMVSMIVSMNWSEAALYKSFESFAKGKHESVSTISTRAAQYIVPGFKFSLLSGLAFLGFVFFMIILILIAALISGLISSVPIGVVTGLAVLFTVVYLFIKMNVALIWGRMYVFLENTGAKNGWDRGWGLSKTKGVKFKTLKMSVVSFFASAVIGVLAMIPLGILIGVPLIAMVVAQQFSLLAIPFFVAAVILGFPFMMFVQSVMKSTTFGAWYYAFQAIKAHKKSSNI